MTDNIYSQELTELRRMKETKSRISSFSDILLPSICFLILLRFMVGISPVSGLSMYPTLNNKDWVVYNRLETNYQRGDIIIARKDAENLLIIKRIVGVPGDVVEVRNGLVYINGEPLDESGYEIIGPTDPYDVQYPLTLHAEEYFVLGDNRVVSLDSRSTSTGVLDENHLLGKLIYHVNLNKN